MKLMPDDFNEPLSPLKVKLYAISWGLLLLGFTTGLILEKLGIKSVENDIITLFNTLVFFVIPFCFITNDLLFKFIKSRAHLVIKCLIILIQIYFVIALLLVTLKK